MPSLTKRREVWFEKVSELLAELHEKDTGFDPAQLAGDEVFVTAVADASRIAMGTHLEGKLDLLKNCLAHLVLAEERDDFMVLRMFHFVEILSPEHFLVLQYMSNPRAWFDGRGLHRPTMRASPESLMQHAELPVQGTSLSMVIRDLSDQGLIVADRLDLIQTHTEMWRSLSTNLGGSLLGFVREI